MNTNYDSTVHALVYRRIHVMLHIVEAKRLCERNTNVSVLAYEEFLDECCEVKRKEKRLQYECAKIGTLALSVERNADMIGRSSGTPTTAG